MTRWAMLASKKFLHLLVGQDMYRQDNSHNSQDNSYNSQDNSHNSQDNTHNSQDNSQNNSHNSQQNLQDNFQRKTLKGMRTLKRTTAVTKEASTRRITTMLNQTLKRTKIM